MQRYQSARTSLVQKMVVDVFVSIVMIILSLLFYSNQIVLVFTIGLSIYCLFRIMIHVYRYCRVRTQEKQ